MATHGQSTRTANQGVYILKQGVQAQIAKPSWNLTRSIFRLFPGLNPENPAEFDPFRLSDAPRDTGDWIRRYDAVVSFGQPGSTWIMADPRDEDQVQTGPEWTLYRAINGAVKSGQCNPAWNPLVISQDSRGAPISQPTELYVTQGICLERRSKPFRSPLGMGPEQSLCIAQFSYSAGTALLDKVDELNEDGQHTCPDFTDLNAGMFLDFHQVGTPTIGGAAQTAQQPVQMLAPMAGAASGAGGAPVNRYEVDLLESYHNGAQLMGPALPGPLGEDAMSKIKPWDDIIRIPTLEERVRLVSSSGIPADAVVYALSENFGEMIPEHVMAQAQAMSGRTQGQGWTPPAGQAATQSAPAPGGFAPPPSQPAPPAAPAVPAAPTTPAPAPAVAPMAPLPAAVGPAPTQPVATPPAGPPATAPATTLPPLPGAAPAASPAVATPPTGPETPAQPTHADPAAQQQVASALAEARRRAQGS